MSHEGDVSDVFGFVVSHMNPPKLILLCINSIDCEIGACMMRKNDLYSQNVL